MHLTSLAVAALLGVAPSLVAAQAEGTVGGASTTLGPPAGTATEGASGSQPGAAGGQGRGPNTGGAPGGGQRVHPVAAGRNPQTNETALRFFPEKIEAQAGEMVQVQFMGGNHSAMLSEFERPCVAISRTQQGAADVWSDYQPVTPGAMRTFTFEVKDTKPMWLCCTQGRHCQQGMCMVVNENTQANSSRSLEAFRQLAASVPPDGVVTPGGTAAGGAAGNATGEAGRTSAASNSAAVPATMLLLLGAAFALL